MHLTIRRGVARATLILLPCLTAFAEAPGSERSLAYDSPTSHQIRMTLAAGEYSVKRSQDSQIHVHWSSSSPKESVDNLQVSFTNARGTAEIRTKHAKAMKVVVQLPSPSDLNIRLAAGELRIEGVEGNKDINMSVGEIRIKVDDPSQYGLVTTSVRLGDIEVSAFHGSRSGFWRLFEFNGQGRYSLHATLGIGDVVLSQTATESN